jgi:hypothetical protein
MKWPFRRKKQDSNIPAMPPEVQQYYQAEQRERTGVAWLLAGITLVVTVLVVMGLFFGGRWVYRKVRHNVGNKGTVATTQQSQDASSSESGASTSTSDNGQSANSSNAGSSSNTPAASTPSSSGSSAATGAGSSASTSQGTVSTTAARTSIPNTGPGDTIGLFAGVSLMGYLAHRVLRRVKA